jgi:dihydropteroate synthase
MIRETLHCGRFQLSLERALIMGVVNVTPDSFSDGGRYLDAEAAASHARRLIEEGADLIDIGGESSRPGAEGVSAEEELRRVVPVLRRLQDVSVPVAIDTVKPEVMRAAVEEGAAMINDISALGAPGSLTIVAESNAAVCLMHMRGEPRTMQANTEYRDVVAEVIRFLKERADAARAGGIGPERIVVDPGFGFGKRPEHNLELLRSLRSIAELGYPVLAGLSRKSTLGALTGKPVGERLAASVAAALLAVQQGARIVRVHDVAATKDALAILAAVQSSS